jgi:hypothetical protein
MTIDIQKIYILGIHNPLQRAIAELFMGDKEKRHPANIQDNRK